jgi:hypothetical protein
VGRPCARAWLALSILTSSLHCGTEVKYMHALETGATQRQRGQSTSPEFAKRRSYIDHVSVLLSIIFYVAVSTLRRSQNHREIALQGAGLQQARTIARGYPNKSGQRCRAISVGSCRKPCQRGLGQSCTKTGLLLTCMPHPPTTSPNRTHIYA